MSDCHVTQTKINALLRELRSWEVLEQRATLKELAEKFDLDPFVVDRVAYSEGIRIKAGYLPEKQSHQKGPEESTLDLELDQVQTALEQADPNPSFQEDKDTGEWKKKPTGEWELVNKNRSKD